MDGKAATTDVRSDFIERMGILAQVEGMPRSAGRMFALLVYDGQPISFSELADLLQISRGNVSSSVRLLEERGVIKRLARPGERQDYFQVAPNAFLTMLQSTRGRMENARGEVEDTLSKLSDDESGVKERLTGYMNFYGAISDGIETAIARLQRHEAKER